MQIEIGMFSVLDSENARELEKMAKFFSVVREPRKSLGKMTKKVVRNSENFPRKCRNFFGGPRTEKKFVKWSASWKRLRTAVLYKFDTASQLVFKVSPPISTHVLSLFVKFLIALLMGSWGKSSHICSKATFNSLIVFGFGRRL